ncbi:MAG: class I SAM-dependent methyltransferase, partial [Bacilli bacterium]
YENYQAVAYYKEMSEREFILGHLHRPWVDYSLQDELILGVLTGNLKIRMVNGQRVVSLTEKGHEGFRSIADILEQSGYLDQRIRHLQVSRFNSAIVFEEVVHKMGPDWIPQRVDFVKWLGIEPGMRVLEIGCGDGLLTIDGGLADRIGPTGSLTAVDPSIGMLTRAEHKLKHNPRPWVRFIQARAEELPFEEGSFDAVVGAAFLHLTDMPRALRELRRVTRQGGIVASFNMLPFGMDAPFFVDWMEPLAELAKGSNRREPKTYLASKSEIEKKYMECGLRIEKTQDMVSRAFYWWPKENINVLIRGLGWAQEELATIPWAAREEMIKVLEDRGEEICQNYSQEERILNVPMQMVKTIVT